MHPKLRSPSKFKPKVRRIFKPQSRPFRFLIPLAAIISLIAAGSFFLDVSTQRLQHYSFPRQKQIEQIPDQAEVPVEKAQSNLPSTETEEHPKSPEPIENGNPLSENQTASNDVPANSTTFVPETIPKKTVDYAVRPAEASRKRNNVMDPQKNWHMNPGAELTNSQELLKVLEPYTKPDSSLEVIEAPAIYGNVTLMMPLSEALVELGLAKELVPSKSPISHPGIPFFFRPFPNKYLLGAGPKHLPDSENYFNLIYIITDAADRVVGIEFVCEAPSNMKPPNTAFLTYNFVLNRRKAVTSLRVRCEVKPLRDDVLMIETWLIDMKYETCLEICRWYLPARVGNFLHHVVDKRLRLSQ